MSGLGGVCLVQGGVSGLGGISGPGGSGLGVCVWSGGVSGLGGCLVQGCVWSGDVSGPGGHAWSGTPPMNRMTHRCKNITLAKTSFRSVIKKNFAPVANGSELVVCTASYIYLTLFKMGLVSPHSVHGGFLPQCMLGYHPLGAGRPTPRDQTTPLGAGTPPGAEHAGRYGQRAGGTHPTGMQSCFLLISQVY